MKLKDLKLKFHSQLDAIYDPAEVSSFFNILNAHYLDLPRHHLAMHPDHTISQSNAAFFLSALNALTNHVPIQYIISETEFFGYSFKVNKNVLIPRPETEELVKWICDEVNKEGLSMPKILDVGTGSGCIAISLAGTIPNSHVVAVDVSRKAIDLAKENAQLNHVNVSFLLTDILKGDNEVIKSDEKYDVIVSNPPYVRQSEKQFMANNVLKNEPHLALFVDDEDPLQFYKAILELSEKKLSNQGFIFFEINEYLGNDMMKLIESYNFESVEIRNDIFGKERMLKARKKHE